jgi:hypothetical protein
MGMAHSMHGTEEEFMEGFSGKSRRKETAMKTYTYA